MSIRELLRRRRPGGRCARCTRRALVAWTASIAACQPVLAQNSPPPVAAVPAGSATAAVVEQDAEGRLVVRAHRIAEPIVVDGHLDEAIYQRVRPASDFVQQEPREGAAATDRTEAWIFFDDAALYVAARCWQPLDVRLIANEMRRDSRNIFENDNFGVILDTFRDGRSGFLFHTNPVGGLSDSYVTDERDSNRDWNTVWDTRTAAFDGGWAVEMVIPFKSLRYPAGATQTWGVNFRRIVRGRAELSYLVPIPASAGPRGMMRVSLAPALVGVTAPGPSLNLELKPYGIATTQVDHEAAIPPDDFDGDTGFDAKFGVTRSLTADFSYNTDFAQVEEDEQQVNLTRFNLFFPEKREFFLEGQGIFTFGGAQAGGPGGGGGPSNTPILFFSRRIGLIETGDDETVTVPIEVGARLSGKAGRWSLGLLDVQTDDSRETGTPATNFGVVRLKRDVFRRSYVGLLGTYRSHVLEGTGSNQVVGADANFAFYDNVSIVAYAARSWTPGFDGDATSYRGQFEYSADLYGLQVEHLYVGEAFNPAVGFLRREAFRRSFGQARVGRRPASQQWLRKWSLEPSFEYVTDPWGQLASQQAQLTGRVDLANGDQWSVDLERNIEVLDEPFDITDDILIPVGAYHFDNLRARYEFGPQRRVSGAASFNGGTFYGGTRREVGWRGRAEITARLSVEPTLTFNWVDLPEGAFQARLLSARTNYALSPRMLASALVQYNSSADALSANVRFRWEYRPGSDLFIVYTEGRDTSVPGQLALANRSFAVKMTRLFRF